MAVLNDTYALDRRVPYFLTRGIEQTVEAPVRHGSTGALVTPDSGTITIVKPDGTHLVSGAAVTVSSSTAQFTLTPSVSETLGEGYEIRWSLVFAAVTAGTFRTAGYMAEYMPANVISATDLYGKWPWMAASNRRRLLFVPAPGPRQWEAALVDSGSTGLLRMAVGQSPAELCRSY